MVNTTESQSPCFEKKGVTVEENGENTGLVAKNQVRSFRYEMQAVAKYFLPSHRVGICLRNQIEKYGSVDVYKHRETQRAFFGGLMVCGSVWVCPVCAAKVSERRRAELKQASVAHQLAGGSLTMLTLTFSHSSVDKLDDILFRLGKASQKFRTGKRYQNLRDYLGLVGSVRALEVTYGENGFHPHIHLLNFHGRRLDNFESMELEGEFYDLWEKACAKYGLGTSRKHGVRLEDASEADQYIGKWGDEVEKTWGIDSELTKANTKKGRVGSMTPFDFLRRVVEEGDESYEKQFIEYAKAMRGRTQLYWSRGLKKKFEIGEKTDEEVATEKLEPADLLGSLSWQDWKYILRGGYRVKLLEYVEKYGLDIALEKLGIKKPTELAPVDFRKKLCN